MRRTFTLSILRNGNGGICSFDREKMLSGRAAQMARQTLGETLATVGGGLDRLAELDAVERLDKGRPNEVADEKPPHRLVQLLGCFNNLFIIALVTLAILQYASITDDVRLIIIIGVTVAVSVGLQFLPECRPALTAEKLKALVGTPRRLLACAALTQLRKSIDIRRFANSR
jgi:P-type Mg2+ transporter